jgi:hypothetical protein
VRIISGLILGSIVLSYSTLTSAADITPAMKAKAEEAIKSCEKTYLNVKIQGQRFDTMKKPSLVASKTAKEAYKNKELYKQVFNQRFAEFATFTNDKIKVRTAPTVQKLQEEVAAYSSNCSRFAAGLANFVEWAVTGTSKEKGYEVIFKDWVKEANK